MSSYTLPCPGCGRMFADSGPRPWHEGDDDDDGERPVRFCPACAARRAAFGYGLAALLVLVVAAAAFAVAYQFL
jgi:hypothetical protein